MSEENESQDLQTQSQDLVTMGAPQGATSVSFDGQTYEVVNGTVDVPHAAVAEMLSHGYTVGKADEEDKTADEQLGKEKKRRGRPAKEQADEEDQS